MASAFAPSAAVYEAWESVTDVIRWSGVSAELWRKTATELGDPDLTNLFVIAGVEDDHFRTATAKIQPAGAAMNKSLLNLTFNAIKTKFNTAIVDTRATCVSAKRVEYRVDDNDGTASTTMLSLPKPTAVGV